jgi:predicted DNA-binding helix-hairpin-helix protein
MPTEQSLKTYAPEKSLPEIDNAMTRLKGKIAEAKAEKKAPRFAPGGQSTQMIVGADTTADKGILTTSVNLYQAHKLRRVYYSAFSPIPDASQMLPLKPAPLIREHRLYQADWLYRFYEFTLDDILAGTQDDMLELDKDPKLAWALRHRHVFPLDLNRAERHLMLRVPGLGVTTVDKIIAIRRYHAVTWHDLVKLRVPLQKVKPFSCVQDYKPALHLLDSAALFKTTAPPQLELFASAT